MENPAEETTVRPNRNQTTRNQTNLHYMRKIRESQYTSSPHDLAHSMPPIMESGSPFFGNQFVKIVLAGNGFGERPVNLADCRDGNFALFSSAFWLTL